MFWFLIFLSISVPHLPLFYLFLYYHYSIRRNSIRENITYFLIISPGMVLVGSSMFASFANSLHLHSVPPSICPFIHPYIQYTYSGVIMVNRKANVFCFPGKWDSLLFMNNQSPIIYIPSFFPFFTLLHISFVFSLMGLPTYVCLSPS